MNNANAQGDVLLTATNDGGEMTIENGIVSMTGGFETAAYLSLFGGNSHDDGSPNNRKSWWGNLLEVDNPDRKMVSRTQYLLDSILPIPSNVNKIIDAANLDLAWFKTTGIADEITITAFIPAYHRIHLSIELKKDHEAIAGLEFEQNWNAMSGEM